MNDKREVEYWIGELKTQIQEIEDMPGRGLWDAEIQRLKDEKKEIEADLKKTKEKLAEAITNRGLYDDAIVPLRDHLRDLEELLPQLLDEADAVEVYKKARASGKFDPVTGIYSSEAKHDADLFLKAAYTLEATTSREVHQRDEMWQVRIFPPYEAHYREWLYGEE